MAKVFDANALIKVRAVHQFCGMDVLADDSGICVPALHGEPGIFSARYAAPNANDQNNNLKLLKNLELSDDRRAYYHCSLAFKDENGMEQIFHGQIHGTLQKEGRGEGGFGYDPLFVPQGESRTFAEMTLDEKKAISHRAIAIREFGRFLSNS
jgi:XTP/dITP diphosphohydrolase